MDSAIVNGNFKSGTLINVSTTTTATLSRAVDLTKAFVYCGAKLASSDLSVFTTCQLTGPTTISIVTGGGTSTNTLNWYVIEYANGVRVQRGSRTSSTLQTIDGQRTLITRLTTSTNLLLQRQATGISLTAEWQVVEFSAGNVQARYAEIPGGASSVTDTILSSVDTSKSFLFFSSNRANSQNGVEFDLYTRGTITNPTTVTFRRKGTTGVNQVAWYVIEMTDGTNVQRGTTNVGGAITTEVQSITNVNVGKSMIVWTNDTGLSGISSHQDSGTFSARFSSCTQIEFERQNSESNPSSVDWFVVAFQ